MRKIINYGFSPIGEFLRHRKVKFVEVIETPMFACRVCGQMTNVGKQLRIDGEVVTPVCLGCLLDLKTKSVVEE